MEIDIKNLKKEFGSTRLVAFLTPDTFTRKIIIISTMFRLSDGKGQTAISQASALNYKSIDLEKLDWKILKEHKTPKEAINFHTKQINNKKFVDCEKV